MFDDQRLGVLQTQADQRIGRTLARAAATEAQFLHIEQANLLFVVEAMEHGFVVQAQQLIGGQGAAQRGDVLPTGGALFFVFQAVGGQLLQQQATGATAIGVQPETRADLLRHDEIVGKALGQGFAVEVDDAW